MGSISYEESMSSKGSGYAGSGTAAAAAGDNLVQIKPQKVEMRLRMSKSF